MTIIQMIMAGYNKQKMFALMEINIQENKVPKETINSLYRYLCLI